MTVSCQVLTSSGAIQQHGGQFGGGRHPRVAAHRRMNLNRPAPLPGFHQFRESRLGQGHRRRFLELAAGLAVGIAPDARSRTVAGDALGLSGAVSTGQMTGLACRMNTGRVVDTWWEFARTTAAGPGSRWDQTIGQQYLSSREAEASSAFSRRWIV